MNTRHILLSFLLAAALAAPAFAQAPASSGDANSTEHTVDLDPLVVVADRGDSLTVPSAQAAGVEIRLTPGGVELIDASRFLRGRASTVEDTFALSPGVIAQSRFGSDEARLSIRGSGIQRTFHGRGLRVLQDGVPLNLADGGFDMQSLEPLSAAYINVWRGGNALAYGGSTLGGAIEYVSRTGRDGAGAATRVEAGSWGYLRANVAAGASRDQLDGYASFTHQEQDGFRDHADQRNERFLGNAGLRLGTNAETRFFLTGVKTVSELPGSLSLAQVESDPSVANPGNIALDQHRDFELLRLANKTSVRTGSTVWDFTAAWTYKDLDHPIFQVVDQLSNDFALSAIGTHVGEFLGANHRLRGGVVWTYGRTNAANFLNSGGTRGALVSSADQTASNLEFFAEEQIRLAGGFTLVAGAVYAINERENERIVAGSPSYTVDYDQFLPKLGLRWDRGTTQLFANVSGSYEPPSFSEALTLNTPRKAQTATTVEIGSRGAYGPVKWDVTLYHATIDDELLAIDHDNNPATPSATVNADSTVHRGAEVGGEIDLLGARGGEHHVVLRAAWTWGDFAFDDDAVYGNSRLAGLPEHLVRVELTWEYRGGWYAGPTLEWGDRIFIDHRNTFAAPAHTIWGLRVGRRQAQGLSWFLEGRNLADKKYAATTGVIEDAAGRDQTQFLPGDGRGFFGGVEYRW
ncbi:MAG: TonB-dependent receptor [Opitutaceae bacterium]|nr:TonB-dependent receptor [Opitutaceae bacterium]